MKILLTGTNGQLGHALQQGLGTHHEVWAPLRTEFDMSDSVQVETQLDAWKPDLILNPAAYTAVDLAEKESPLANAVNHTSVARMAHYAKENKALLIHYSTDYVFDGRSEHAYRETDPCNPMSVYGRTKYLGEQAIQDIDCAHLILRTSWVYSARGKNFLLTMLRLAQERPELRIVADQFGTPNSAAWLAQATLAILQPVLSGEQNGFNWMHQRRGIYHLSAAQSCSWFEFASAIFEKAFALGILKTTPRIEAIPSSAYPTPAQRPMNSRLNCSKIEQQFGLVRPDWRALLDSTLNELV